MIKPFKPFTKLEENGKSAPGFSRGKCVQIRDRIPYLDSIVGGFSQFRRPERTNNNAPNYQISM